MATITILPEEKNFRAVSKNKESVGRTAGEALDALTAQFNEEEKPRLVMIHNQSADKFFNAAQQTRLTELLQKREKQFLTDTEETELENLVDAELNGARERTEASLHELKP